VVCLWTLRSMMRCGNDDEEATFLGIKSLYSPILVTLLNLTLLAY
jgi:hypothetical protein